MAFESTGQCANGFVCVASASLRLGCTTICLPTLTIECLECLDVMTFDLDGQKVVKYIFISSKLLFYKHASIAAKAREPHNLFLEEWELDVVVLNVLLMRFCDLFSVTTV